MAVLIEAICVVVRCQSIIDSYRGGIESFIKQVPNSTLCADGELASISFMTPQDIKKYSEFLEFKGLVKEKNNTACDFVVVDQLSGLCSQCEWVLFGKTDWNNDPLKPISVCISNPAKIENVFVPQGWVYEQSISSNYKYIDGKIIPTDLQFVRREGNIDILKDKKSGQEFYVRRL